MKSVRYRIHYLMHRKAFEEVNSTQPRLGIYLSVPEVNTPLFTQLIGTILVNTRIKLGKS